MRTELQTLFSMNKFFRIVESADQHIKYNFKEPSILLMKNVYYSWLQTILSKIPKNMVVFTSKKNYQISKPPCLPFGFLDNNVVNYNESTVVEQSSDDLLPKMCGQLIINIFVPQHENIQHFINWQRYRKYWWSSISTTPSLFVTNEINYANNTADANITAQFQNGQYTVETIRMNTNDNKHNAACITCSTSLENALIVLLQDGLNNNTKDEYLRLHRSMAPYKIAFVLNAEDGVNKGRLCELAELMHHKLKKNKISSLLPNFSLTMEHQIKENLQLGVAYTAILCETTLTNGIIQLLNSSTMLKEQVHLADFDSYTKMLCK